MSTDEMVSKNKEELEKELLALAREQFNLRIQKATGQLSKTHLLKAVRRNIARVKTALRQSLNEKN